MKTAQSSNIRQIEKRINYVLPLLNERQRRLYLASEILTSEDANISTISKISGFSRNTLATGLKELKDHNNEYISVTNEIRKSGAGRRKINDEFPDFLKQLDQLMMERGKSNQWAVWCDMSIRDIMETLKEKGQWIGKTTLSNSLRESGYIYHASGGNLDKLFDTLASTEAGETVIGLETYGMPVEILPPRVWNFVKEWWGLKSVIAVGTLPESSADGFPNIQYFQMPTGYIKWKKRILCASLRISNPEEEESTCLIWEITCV